MPILLSSDTDEEGKQMRTKFITWQDWNGEWYAAREGDEGDPTAIRGSGKTEPDALEDLGYQLADAARDELGEPRRRAEPTDAEIARSQAVIEEGNADEQ